MCEQRSILPGDADFADFRTQCLCNDNWQSKFKKNDMQVWVEVCPTKKGNHAPKVHKIKCKITIDDVPAATMYDVLHDGEYRKKWDTNMDQSFDIARLSANADVGYYSWKCPKPIMKRDVVTLRSWKMTESKEFIIINFSVKHPQHPPRKDCVRAVSLLTGYLIQPTGPKSCVFTYLSHADPKGALPKWMVNKASQVLAPKVLKSVHKAGVNYQEWKKQNCPDHKPWLNPKQCTLPEMEPTELSIQRGDSLENLDESSMVDPQDNEDSS